MIRRLLALGFACACLFGSAAGTSHAQWAVDFAFGGGGPHCHHRPHWHGGYYGGYYGWYRPYPYYVAPAPVYVQPIVTQPVAVPVAYPAAAAATPPAATASIAATQPSLRTNTLPTTQRAVRLKNPSDSGGNVSFVVDGKSEVSLQPGDMQALNSKNSYTVEFDRGGNFGTARRELVEGTYEFVVTENGWDLERLPTEPTPTGGLEPVVRRNTLPTTQR
jgi:hypothetical protein